MNDLVAELAGLRRRAYGPDADITADPAALERLVELERALREVRRSEDPVAAVDALDSVDAVEPADPAVRVAAKRGRAAGHPGIVWGIVVGIAAVTGLIVAVGVPNIVPAAIASAAPSDGGEGDATPFGGEAASRLLQVIPIGGSFGGTIGGAVGGAVSGSEPPFPVAEGLGWSALIGTYYGWELWLARSRSGLPCVALARAQETRAKCLLPGHSETAGLAVSVPYDSVAAEDRPDGMSPGESIGYQWLSDRTVSIVVGHASNASAIIGRRR